MAKLGFADRKTEAPTDMRGLVALLSSVMSASINNEIDLDNARVALNAATRIVEALQADTRMKAVALSSGRTLTSANGFAMIEMEKAVTKIERGAMI
ncbi:MAG: hypothetical protein IPP91_11100 [Betaproteobacteria bacterium]|nr:hypothetical protein [Betaproteobacteria bacterium]